MMEIRTERKKAILEVLEDYIDPDKFNSIAKRWENEYSDKPQFGMAQFLTELYDTNNMDITKGDLIRELNKGLQVVNEKYKTHHTKQNNLSGREKAEQTIFCIMFKSFVANFDKSSLMTLIHQLVDSIRNYSPKIANDQQRALAYWMENKGALSCGAISFELLKAIFSESYFFACEQFGPVKADRFLTIALNEAAASPAANEVSPTELISA